MVLRSVAAQACWWGSAADSMVKHVRVNDSTINVDSIIAQLLDESRRINSIKAKNSYKAPIVYDLNYGNSNNNKNSYSNDVEMSMQTNNNTKANNSFKNKNKFCKFCKKQGHIIDSCYQKNPEVNTKLNSKQSNKAVNSSMCRIVSIGRNVSCSTLPNGPIQSYFGLTRFIAYTPL